MLQQFKLLHKKHNFKIISTVKKYKRFQHKILECVVFYFYNWCFTSFNRFPMDYTLQTICVNATIIFIIDNKYNKPQDGILSKIYLIQLPQMFKRKKLVHSRMIVSLNDLFITHRLVGLRSTIKTLIPILHFDILSALEVIQTIFYGYTQHPSIILYSTYISQCFMDIFALVVCALDKQLIRFLYISYCILNYSTTAIIKL